MQPRRDEVHSKSTSDYLTPMFSEHGLVGTVGGYALRDALLKGSRDHAVSLLNTMDAEGMALTLGEVGFSVPKSVVFEGRHAVFSSVKLNLNSAAQRRVDGFGLRPSQIVSADAKSLAAKEISATKPSFVESEFAGSYEAAALIQSVMRASSVDVDLLGDASPGSRFSLVLVAAQAVQNGIQGFAFDGVDGKYKVAFGLADVQKLHGDAIAEFSLESTRVALSTWSSGKKVTDLCKWVPDSVQRLLHGSVSLSSATSMVAAISNGALRKHATAIGVHSFSALIKAQGLDVNALTIDQQAEHLGLTIVEANTDRGNYIGQIVGVDHRAALIKFSRTSAVELPFDLLSPGEAKPVIGNKARMSFNNKVGTISIDRVAQRDSVMR